MTIALRGISATATAGSGNPLTVSVPAGVVNGDVMVLLVEGNAANKTVPTPAGWTLIDIYANASLTPSMASFYRVASSEPASYVVSTGGLATATAGFIIAYSGVDNTTPINAHGAWNNNTTSISQVATSITTTVNGCQLLFLWGSPNSSTVSTPPAGFTSESAISAIQIYVADENQPTAGATGTATMTLTGTRLGDAQLVALAPVPAPTNSVAPSVSGSAPVGSTLSTTDGTWTGSPTFTYQWTRDGVNIASATSNTYVTQAADVGHAVGCTVTATNVGGSASQASSNTITPTSAGIGPTVVGKTGTSGSAIMQKAASGWTYVTGKTGGTATAIAQKTVSGWTKVTGH